MIILKKKKNKFKFKRQLTSKPAMVKKSRTGKNKYIFKRHITIGDIRKEREYLTTWWLVFREVKRAFLRDKWKHKLAKKRATYLYRSCRWIKTFYKSTLYYKTKKKIIKYLYMNHLNFVIKCLNTWFLFKKRLWWIFCFIIVWTYTIVTKLWIFWTYILVLFYLFY